MNKNNYSVKKITAEETKPFLLDIHYAKSIPSISYSFGLFEVGVLVGVCTYGTPFSPGIRNILKGSVLELNRLVLINNKLNEASYLVGNSLKLLPKDNIVVSFADPSQDHVGYVYQACNFDYYGLTEKRNNMKIKGKNTHAYTTGSYIKNNKNIEYTYEKRQQKHRYIALVGDRTFKKFAKEILNKKYNKLAYPKLNTK